MCGKNNTSNNARLLFGLIQQARAEAAVHDKTKLNIEPMGPPPAYESMDRVPYIDNSQAMYRSTNTDIVDYISKRERRQEKRELKRGYRQEKRQLKAEYREEQRNELSHGSIDFLVKGFITRMLSRGTET